MRCLAAGLNHQDNNVFVFCPKKATTYDRRCWESDHQSHNGEWLICLFLLSNSSSTLLSATFLQQACRLYAWFYISGPPETAGRVWPSRGQCRRPASWLPCPVCCSGVGLGPGAGWWSACPQCCRAPKGTGSAGSPSFPEHPGSFPDEAHQLAGYPKKHELPLKTPSNKWGNMFSAIKFYFVTQKNKYYYVACCSIHNNKCYGLCSLRI